MEDTLERVKIDMDEDEIRRLIDVVDHYEAYLHSQQRDEAKFRDLLVRLRKTLAKRPWEASLSSGANQVLRTSL